MIAMAFKPTKENPGWKVRVGETAEVLIGDRVIASKPVSEAHILCKQIIDYDRFNLHCLFTQPFEVTHVRGYDTCELLRIVLSALDLSNGRKIVHYSGRDDNGYSNFTVSPAARFYMKDGRFHEFVDMKDGRFHEFVDMKDNRFHGFVDDFGRERLVDTMAIDAYDCAHPFTSRLELKLMAKKGATKAIAKDSRKTTKTKTELKKEQLENKLAEYKNG